jgi:hypothetical protein
MAEVKQLKQPTTFAGLSARVEQEIEAAYWNFDAMKKGYGTHARTERDAFKWALREMFHKLRSAE